MAGILFIRQITMTVLNRSNITDTRRYLDLDEQAVSQEVNEMAF
ncbi:hypothetical protein [Citrobacter sp. Igbk 17]|nr:hypothetical protein [Citrobacter sp. Igbk 17]